MKSSFYYVLWIGLYMIFDWINVPFLQNNSFVAAFIIVIIVQNLLNKSLAPDIMKDQRFRTLRLYEEIYTNNIKAYRDRMLYNVILYSVFAIYFVFTFVWILRFADYSDFGNSLFEIVIFGGLGAYYVYRATKLVASYSRILRATTLKECLPDIDNYEDYRNFSELRSYRTYAEILNSQPRVSSFYNILNIVFSVMSILLGVWFLRLSLPNFFHFSEMGMYMIILLLYGALALQAGIKDLISSSR